MFKTQLQLQQQQQHPSFESELFTDAGFSGGYNKSTLPLSPISKGNSNDKGIGGGGKS